MIEVLSFEAPPVDEREILRYAVAKDESVSPAFLEECLKMAGGVLNYRVVFCELKFTTDGENCNFGDFSIKSFSLAENLKTAKRVFLLAATVGHGIDRLVSKYSSISPLKALLFSAIGTERVEALADAFCSYLEKKYDMSSLPRFSAGYGDLPLSAQADIFRVLKPENQIALYLSESLMMSPLKSVTAFVGLK